MNAFSSFLLGLVQGVAEFLPISSSGHLSIARNFLNIEAVPDFFDVLLHLGTLGAVFVAYWKDIKDMIAEFFRGIGDLAHRSTPKPLPPARRLILLIILGTLPLFAVLPIKDKVEALKNNVLFVGSALIVTGFLLFICDRVRKGKKNERTASLLDAVAVGVSQAVATVPGLSRSGMTITSGCFVGFDRKFAVRFSFLLSIPAVLGANILSIAEAVQEVFGRVGTQVIGTRHGEKLFETLMTREERLRAEDMGGYYRVACDSRDLNYDKFVVDGEVETQADESYTSHNTERLDVEGTIAKIKTAEYVQLALEGREHEAVQ